MPAAKPSSEEKEVIALRIRVVDPAPGVRYRVQRGKADLLAPTSESAREIVFDLSARLGPERERGVPNFLGEFVQGPVGDRFVYVNTGTCAGDAASCWTRRAKVKLAGITRAMVDAALRGGGKVLEARYAGCGKDGGPSCATVPIEGGEWRVAEARRKR